MGVFVERFALDVGIVSIPENVVNFGVADLVAGVDVPGLQVEKRMRDIRSAYGPWNLTLTRPSLPLDVDLRSPAEDAAGRRDLDTQHAVALPERDANRPVIGA